MKYKTTRKAIVNGTSPATLRRCGYCDISELLRTESPTAYTAGVYGWNFDVYHVHGLTITTGYRNMCGTRLERCEEYNKRAREVWMDYTRTWDDRAQDVRELLREFCELNGGY